MTKTTTKPQAAELSPCPFCGTGEYLSMQRPGSLTADMPARPHRVVCTHIDHDTVIGPTAFGEHAARAAWNKRALASQPTPSAVGEERVAVLEAFFDGFQSGEREGFFAGYSKGHADTERNPATAWKAHRPTSALTTTTSSPINGEALARRFHEIYERRAPEFGYETRTETRQFDPTTPNGQLMVAVCSEIATAPPLDATLREKARAVFEQARGDWYSKHSTREQSSDVNGAKWAGIDAILALAQPQAIDAGERP